MYRRESKISICGRKLNEHLENAGIKTEIEHLEIKDLFFNVITLN